MAGGRPAPPIQREPPWNSLSSLFSFSHSYHWDRLSNGAQTKGCPGPKKHVSNKCLMLIVSNVHRVPFSFISTIFSNKSMDDTYKSHNERKLRSSMYSQMVILWKRGYCVCVYTICVCSYYVCGYSLKKQQKSTCQIVKVSITKYHNAA